MNCPVMVKKYTKLFWNPWMQAEATDRTRYMTHWSRVTLTFEQWIWVLPATLQSSWWSCVPNFFVLRQSMSKILIGQNPGAGINASTHKQQTTKSADEAKLTASGLNNNNKIYSVSWDVTISWPENFSIVHSSRESRWKFLLLQSVVH